MKRRKFLQTVPAVMVTAPILNSLGSCLLFADDGQFKRPVLTPSNEIELGGLFGKAYDMSLARLTRKPFDTNFILADLNFNQKRMFTNFSGDISGRFIEVASLTSKKNRPQPDCLAEVIDKAPDFQKADGHFGAPVEWMKPMDTNVDTNQAVMMPILWGNGRIFLGLLAAWERFGNEKALESAKKLGDFYINTVIKRFCDPKRMAEYQKDSVGYASAYVTCVFHGIEGLVRCWRLTRERKYLDAAIKMADFHEPFDVLPVRHSHGSLSAHEALMMLYEETGEKRFLNRVVSRWEKAVGDGYINPCGSVLEFFFITNSHHDEGCSEADWLRLNLMLWRNTGHTRYLDMAERLLYNGYLANQWPTGGFGHRVVGYDETGPFSWRKPAAESVWCCSFHCPLGLYEFKEYLAVSNGNTVYYNFPTDFKAPVKIGDSTMFFISKSLSATDNVPIRTSFRLEGNANAAASIALRVPEWADKVVIQMNGKNLAGKIIDGYFYLTEPVKVGIELTASFVGQTYLETRRLKKQAIPKTLPATMEGVVLKRGPFILISKESTGEKIESLTVSVKNGQIQVPDSLGWFANMSYQEQDKPHTFVFNVDFK